MTLIVRANLKKWIVSESAANDRLSPQFGPLVGSKTSRFNIPPFLRERERERERKRNGRKMFTFAYFLAQSHENTSDRSLLVRGDISLVEATIGEITFSCENF